MKTNIIAAILTATFAATNGVAHAGGGGAMTGGATEMTQIMNNVQLAMQTVESELQTVEMIEQTYLGRLQQMKQSIGQYTAPFQKAMATYQKVQDLQYKLNGMRYSLENMKGMLDTRYLQYSASNLNWNDWTAREARAIQHGDQRARMEIEANRRMLESSQDSLNALQKSAEGLDASTGTHQAVRMLGPMLTTIGGDINKLVTATTLSNYSAADARHIQNAKERATAIDAATKNIEREEASKATSRVAEQLMRQGK